MGGERQTYSGVFPQTRATTQGAAHLPGAEPQGRKNLIIYHNSFAQEEREGAEHDSVSHSQMVFSQDHHEHVLNLCLAQFEPDSADYIKVGCGATSDLHVPRCHEDKKRICTSAASTVEFVLVPSSGTCRHL